MKLTSRPLRTLGVALTLGVPIAAFAADHGDVPSSAGDPSADITDLYAWMTADATKLNLVAAVNPGAGNNTTFSDAVVYEFAVSSSARFGEPQSLTRITCKFIDGTNVECWAGNDYVVGDPREPAGIVSDGGAMRVFAGLRDDPFFLEYAGFQEAIDTANSAVAANMVTFPPDNQGCPALSAEQQALLLGALTADGRATNTFAGQNVLALVIQINKEVVSSGGPVLGVSVSTYASN
jgi:hypothetical protein